MTHRIQFNTAVAKALVNGAAIPVPFVQQFVQQAYDVAVYAQELEKRVVEMECSELKDKYEKS